MIDIDNMIKSLRNKHVYIQMHNFPDPDAIASAYGLQYLLGAKGLASTIVYKGKANYGSSYSMVQRLGIEIVEIEAVNITPDTEIMIVDAQMGNANIATLPGNGVVCFDHHKTYESAQYMFSDIRPWVGACASMIAEYMFNYGVDIDTKMATALLYGIKVDTANLTRSVSQLDLDMFYRLYTMADQDIIRDLDSSVLTVQDLKAYSMAIDSIKIAGRTCYANVGYNCPEALVASVSDFMMKLERIDNTVVYSVKDDGIRLSVRTATNMNVGDITNEALKGIGSGGGHENMSGGFVPYNPSVEDPVHDQIYIERLIEEIEKRFAKLIVMSYNT
jgi:nanoRNase/pAp phosphatase (c-di-AMP/oligoRNAs hydrolase)